VQESNSNQLKITSCNPDLRSGINRLDEIESFVNRIMPAPNASLHRGGESRGSRGTLPLSPALREEARNGGRVYPISNIKLMQSRGDSTPFDPFSIQILQKALVNGGANKEK
jgi:hypothetical protein